MVLLTPVEPGTLTYSDMEAGVSDILLVSRLQWEILERLRLAGSGCQLSEIQSSFVFALVGSGPTAVHYARRWGL